MLRQMQCCQLCLRPRCCAATARVVSTGTVSHASVAEQSASDKALTAASSGAHADSCATAHTCHFTDRPLRARVAGINERSTGNVRAFDWEQQGSLWLVWAARRATTAQCLVWSQSARARQLWKLRCQCTVGPCMHKMGSTRAALIMRVYIACSTTVRSVFPLDCSGPLCLAVHR